MPMHATTPIVLSTLAFSTSLHLAVALLVQEDVVAGHPWVHAYTKFFREAIPAIDRLAGVSPYPELARLVFSLMWTLVPILMVFYLKTGAQALAGRFHRRPLYATIPALCLALLAASFFAKPESALLAWSDSRLGLGLFAGFYAPAMALCLCVVLSCLVSFAGKSRERPITPAAR